MPIAVRCPRCGFRYDLPDHLAGRSGHCSACNTAFTVPAGDAFNFGTDPIVPPATVSPTVGPAAPAPKRGWSPAVIVGNIVFLVVVPLLTLGIIAGVVWYKNTHPATEEATDAGGKSADHKNTQTGPAKPDDKRPARFEVGALAKQLADPDAAVRKSAAMKLRDAPYSAEVAPALLAALADADAGVAREAAAAAVAWSLSPKQYLSEILSALRTAPHEVGRRGAASLLAAGGTLPPGAVQPLLNAAMTDKSMAVRAEALTALGHAGAADRGGLFDPLLKMQADRDADVRRAAAEALNRFGAPRPEQLPAVLAALKYENAAVRSLAMRLLEQMGPDAAGSGAELLAATKDPTPDVRAGALRLLARLAPRKTETRAALIAAATDKDAEVRRAAVVGLSQIGQQPGIVTALLSAGDLSPADGEIWNQIEVAVAAYDAVPPEDSAAVLKAVRCPSPRVRVWAAQQASKLGSGTAVLPELAAQLKKSDGPTKLDLLRTVEQILIAGHFDQKPPEGDDVEKLGAVAEVLAAMLDDRDIAVRAAAVAVLGRVGPAGEKAVPLLVQKLGDATYAAAAVTALGQIGPAAASATPDLVKVLDGQKMQTVRKAVGVDASTGAPFFATVLTDPNLDPLRRAAAQALGRFGAAAVPELVKALRHKNPAVRLGVCQALAEIGPDAKDALKTLDLLAGATEVEFAPVRKAAREAAAAIKGKKDK